MYVTVPIAFFCYIIIKNTLLKTEQVICFGYNFTVIRPTLVKQESFEYQPNQHILCV